MSQAPIRRQPVLNKQKAITASRFILQAASSAEAAAVLNSLGDTWPTSRDVIVTVSGCDLDDGLLAWQPPANTMVEFPAAALTQPAAVALMEKLTAAGTGLCLGDYRPDLELPAGIKFRYLLADARCNPGLLSAPAPLLATGLANHKEFGDALIGGYDGAAGWFFLHGMPVSDKLNPSHANTVRVLNLVRQNADVKDIEAALKQDVTLSFKLLRYINSVGFGLSCEIQSFKHAVTILGYEKLNRWLSLLLVTASKDPIAPALMQASVARGRFMELVGAGSFDKTQTDNLFITGAFSLLDTLLGSKLEAVLQEMHLPEAIRDALLERSGLYGPYLDLALSCEGDDTTTIAAKTEALFLTPERVNHAQFEALQFADSLQFN
ncbi:MAG: HDOD domain-containing protein [Rhodocyclaceae bacterium]|nr:HDOD domain-containing protein [Rhodocyclaceae bacterium]